MAALRTAFGKKTTGAEEVNPLKAPIEKATMAGTPMAPPAGMRVGKKPVTFSQAFTTLLDGAFAAKSGKPLPKGSFTPMMIGPGAAGHIKGFEPGKGVQAVYLKPKKGGK